MMLDWTEFCEWIRDAMGLTKLPIEWVRYEKDGFKIVRIDLCKDKPYHVTTVIVDRHELCIPDVAYELARTLVPLLSKAIKTNSPYTYIRHFYIKVVV